LASGDALAFVPSLDEYIIAHMLTVLFVAIAALVFGLPARFGDPPKLRGARSAGER